eukprot:2874648-Heterocapsa_arctica.AAC.1
MPHGTCEGGAGGSGMPGVAGRTPGKGVGIAVVPESVCVLKPPGPNGLRFASGVGGGEAGPTRTWDAGSKAPKGLLGFAGGGLGSGVVKDPGLGCIIPCAPNGLGMGGGDGGTFTTGVGSQLP